VTPPAGPTRRGLLVGGLAAGTALGGAAPGVEAAGVDALGRLLTLEQRLAAAYRAALERDAIDPALGARLLGHEREHVRGVEVALTALGGASPRGSVTPPEQGRALGGRREFARYALDLETEAVRGYVELLATLAAPKLLQPLGSIMACGAQHGVALRRVLGIQLL
jgi:Ferritin-like domain